MVKKIKKKRRVKRVGGGGTWTVPFDAEGHAGVYIHKHGDGDDHSECGPVVLCCERAGQRYRNIAPELHSGVSTYQAQGGTHLASWFDTGVGAMYFVLCDPDDEQAVYQFGLAPDEARKLLLGQTPRAQYRRADCRYTVPAVIDA